MERKKDIKDNDMQVHDNLSGPEEACDPVWVRLNPLYSYCVKSISAPSPRQDDQAALSEADLPRCHRKACVFSKKRN
jgi:hypothetical protein